MHLDHQEFEIYPNYNSITHTDLDMYDDQSMHDFYPNSQLAGQCYDGPSTHLDQHTLAMDRVNRGALVPQYPYHGPVPSAVDPNSINSLYPSQSWQYHSPLEAEKRGSVIMGQAPTLPQPAAKRKGGRKPKDDPNLPPSEKEKRRLRRLRNKEAAAKCRERRLNHTSSLLQQIQQLEKSQTAYEEQITQLRQHKEQCEKLLSAHYQDCSKKLSTKSPATASSSAAASVAASQSSTAVSSPASSSSDATPPPPSTNLLAAAASLNTSANRRKQLTPRLKLDVSCADSHRRTSSSSSGGLQSPVIH
ncbi:kay [Bugula neritina]|uniref:Kay n=1 Tax=Bugula neritina TaxID=10212 RepID=A0A7J7JJI8_BUGNE|nr:kay [Bugula neritina]